MKHKWFRLLPIVLILMLAVPQTVSAGEEDVRAMLNTLNDRLAAAGENFRVEKAEFTLVGEAVGPTVYANDREHQLDSLYMPYDPWRFGVRDIYWAIDHVDQAADVPWPDAVAAIGRAMNTWNTVPCANIPLTLVDDYGLDLGYVQYWYWYDPDAGELPGHNGGANGWLADITHAGWLPAGFWDTIWGPGGGDNILGVTFTFTWVARNNVAFKEIYYNEVFNWGIDIRYFDIETVVAHEVGHGLCLGHFGKIFRDGGTGKLHFAPRALMNAIYYDILHGLLGTDNASFCSIWASWPNN